MLQDNCQASQAGPCLQKSILLLLYPEKTKSENFRADLRG